MATTLAQAYVQILPTTRGLKSKLTSELNGDAPAIGGKSGFGGKFSAAFKGAVAAAGIGAAITKSIQEGAKLEQSIGGIETIFGKKDAQIVKQNAKNAYKTLQISANDYMEQTTSFSASLLQSLNGDTAKAAKVADIAISDMSDNANKMGTNIGDIQNAYQGFAKQNYTMLDNLKLGYGGTKTEMQRLLQDAGKLTGKKYDISNLADVYEAIHVIQKQMGLTGTSAKEAQTTLSGSFNAMKAAATNFMGNLTLGKDVGPAMQGLVTTTSTFLFKNLMPAIGRIFQSLPAAMGTFIKQGVPMFLDSGKQMLDSLAQGMKGSGGVIIEALKGALDLSRLIREKSGGIIKSGAQMLVNLANGISEAMPKFAAMAPEIIDNLANTINDNLPIILKAGAQIIIALAKGVIKSIPVLIKNFPKIAKTIFDVWAAVNWINLGKTLITKAGAGLKAMAGKLPELMKAIMAKLKTAAWNGIKAIPQVIKSSLAGVGNLITAPFRIARGLVGAAISKIKSVVNFAGLAAKVKGPFNAVKSAITSPLTAARNAVGGIVRRIKGFFPLHIGKIMSGIRLPHISVSGGKPPFGIAGKGSLPKFAVHWNAEGGIVDSPTILQGAGEAGPEGIIPLTEFWRKMDNIAKAMQTGSGGGTLTVIMNLDGTKIAENTIEYVNDQTIVFGTNPLKV